tara:strand:- start:93 stop:1379 length:1287 start_codon:yes stop_codon:yes gene_type:complete
MGSTFVTKQKSTKGFEKIFGSTTSEEVFLQFVPGIVGQVITSYQSLTFDGKPRKINSILAKPHFGNKIKKTALLDEEDRYYPLFRGFVDVPVVGDPVLLCTIGGVQYYLGPLNTANSPNFNIDHLNKIESKKKGWNTEITNREVMGLSKNFKKLASVARLQKLFKAELDDPSKTNKTLGEIHGDTLIEGRHGNSIRIGSRNVNPYIIISNARVPSSIVEGAADGSILAMIEHGTIRQHFNTDKKKEGESTVLNPWMLASDTVEENERLISTLVSDINDGGDATEIIYDYVNNQLFQNSERVIINARTESMFLSSFKNIHVGAGNSLTISVRNETVIESKNIFLGKASRDSEAAVRQGLVVGENWRALFEEFIDIFLKANGHCQGAPLPFGFNNGVPGSLIPELMKIRNKIGKDANNFVSNKHYIELNG